MGPDSNTIAGERKKILDDITKLTFLEEMNRNLLRKKTDTIFAPIRNKLKESLKKIAIENSYSYIFELNTDAKFPLPLYDDITGIVMTKLGL